MADEDTYYDQIANSIMESPEVQKKMLADGQVYMAYVSDLRAALTAAAKMGAEAVVGLIPEHDVEMGWVCTVCREPIVAKDIDENHTIWVHKEEAIHV